MDYINQLLSERAVGQYQISIATSLAFEGAFGILQDKPNPPKPPILDYGEVWVNVRTLFRNLIGSMPKEFVMNNGDPIPLALTLNSEMSVISGLVSKAKVRFYVCTYDSLTRHYPHAQFRDAKTDRQKVYAQLENLSIEYLLKEQANLDNEIKVFDTILQPDSSARTLIVTHYPFDLLSYPKFLLLNLLESHTGVVKSRAKWNTKLKEGNTLERIPFDRMTVQLFGDSGGLLKPYPATYRKAMYDLAEEYRWNTLTTVDRIKQSVKMSNNASLQILVTQLYSSVL